MSPDNKAQSLLRRDGTAQENGKQGRGYLTQPGRDGVFLEKKDIWADMRRTWSQSGMANRRPVKIRNVQGTGTEHANTQK